MKTRYAIVEGTTVDTVNNYLPSNYRAHETENGILIEGEDDHGWTLDGYVIPRLGSGLIAAREIKPPAK